MTILTTNESRSETRLSLELACGKKAAYVGYNFRFGMVDVCVYNASHKVWGGMGRTFRSFSEALDAYKSPEVKAMIEHLQDAVKPTLAIVG